MKYVINSFGWAAVGLLIYLSSAWLKASNDYSADFAAATSANGIALTLFAAAIVIAALMVVYMHLTYVISRIPQQCACKCSASHTDRTSSESKEVV